MYSARSSSDVILAFFIKTGVPQVRDFRMGRLLLHFRILSEAISLPANHQEYLSLRLQQLPACSRIKDSPVTGIHAVMNLWAPWCVLHRGVKSNNSSS
jgi:hypothetical protein